MINPEGDPYVLLNQEGLFLRERANTKKPGAISSGFYIKFVKDYSSIEISTRLFLTRPASIALSATGLDSP